MNILLLSATLSVHRTLVDSLYLGRYFQQAIPWCRLGMCFALMFAIRIISASFHPGQSIRVKDCQGNSGFGSLIIRGLRQTRKPAQWRNAMNNLKHRLLGSALKAVTLGLIGASVFAIGVHAQSSTDLPTMAKDPAQWVMPSGNYANWRYSTLDQLNTSNVKNLQVAWTMSTGTDRGLEGQPLVIGNMMYYETLIRTMSSRSIWTIRTRSRGNSPRRPMTTHRALPVVTSLIAGRPMATARSLPMRLVARFLLWMPKRAMSSGKR